MERDKRRQVLATLIVNLSTLAHGLMIGWSSPNLVSLQSKENPFDSEPLTDEQISWLNSIIWIGGLMILPICNLMCEKWGRKFTGYVGVLPYLICWFLIYIATDYSFLIVARFLAGVGGTIFIFLIPIYIGEISSNVIRGFLGSFMIFSIKIGILLGYIIGAALSFKLFAIIAFFILIIFLISFIFVPETPIWLLRKERIKETKEALKWLMPNADDCKIDLEIKRIQNTLKKHPDDGHDDDRNKSIKFKDLFRDKGTTKALVIALVLLGSQQSCGISVLLTYTSMIFKTAGGSLSPNLSTIIIGFIQLIGCYLSINLIDKIGRKFLILTSCFGMAFCHLLLAAFFYAQMISFQFIDSISWLPIVSLSTFLLFYCIGMGPVPFVIVSEIFIQDISSLGISVSMIFMIITAFITMKLFPLVIQVLGIHFCFIIMSLFCIINIIFTIFFIPETKSKSVESIFNELNSSNCFSKKKKLKKKNSIINNK